MSLGLGSSCAEACPYIGLHDDPLSRASYPREDHVCRALRRNDIDLAWQERYCLSSSFAHCTRYRETQPHGILRPVIVAPPPSSKRAAIIFLTIVILIWLTSAVSVTTVVVNQNGPRSAPNPASLSRQSRHGSAASFD